MKLILSLVLFMSFAAQAAPIIQTNGCFSRHLYFALTAGANVTMDKTGNKLLSVNGQNLIECSVIGGSTVSCQDGYGGGYSNSNYACAINFQSVQGNDADILMSSLKFDPGGFTPLSIVVAGKDYNFNHRGCIAQICEEFLALECDKSKSSCVIKDEVNAYNP